MDDRNNSQQTERSRMHYGVTILVGATCSSLALADAVLHLTTALDIWPTPWLHHVLVAPIMASIGISFALTSKGMLDRTR